MKTKCARLGLPLLLLMSGFIIPTQSLGVTFIDQSDRLQIVNAHLMDIRPSDAPVPRQEFLLEHGVDFLYQPTVDNKVGDKEEDINTPPVIPRPRLRYHLPHGFYVGGALIPPLEVEGFSATLIGLEGGYRLEKNSFLLGLWTGYSNAKAKGPITENDVEDHFYFDRTTVDASLGYRYKQWAAYAGGGQGHLNTRLEVDVDGVVMKIKNHSYSYAFAGLSYDHKPWSINFEQSQTEEFMRHFTISASYLFYEWPDLF